MGVVTESSRLEFFVLGLEVEVKHPAGKMFGSFEFALDECLVDDQLHGDVCQFTSLPCLYLLSHRLEIVLHAVNAHRDAVNERKRLRVFREHGRKSATEGEVLMQIGSITDLGVAPKAPRRSATVDGLVFPRPDLRSRSCLLRGWHLSRLNLLS